MANIIHITDFNAPELDIYARLTEKQTANSNYFVAESPEVIRLALKSGCKPLSFLLEEKHIETTAKDLLEQSSSDIPVYAAKAAVISKLTGFHLTRGVLCTMERPSLPSATEICKNASRIAVLENVMNPTNIGAIFRCAAALNMDAVLLTEAGSDPLARRATRTGMGTMFQVPWTIFSKKTPWQDTLKEMGFKTLAMVLRDDSRHIADPCFAEEPKLAIVLGNEGDGLTTETINTCDYAVKIPMSHEVDSLNVATAAAIAFYQFGVISHP